MRLKTQVARLEKRLGAGDNDERLQAEFDACHVVIHEHFDAFAKQAPTLRGDLKERFPTLSPSESGACSSYLPRIVLADFYSQYEHTLAALQLAFAMLGMGALLSPRDFVTVFTLPRALSVGLFLQWLLIPGLAVGLPTLMTISGPVTVALVLVAAVPGGTMSNIYTYLARGNIALSISLTAVTTAASLVVTPMLLGALAGEHLPAGFSMPIGKIATEIAIVLLLPLLLGMVIGSRIGERRERFARAAIRVSVFMIILLVVGATGSDRLDPSRYSQNDQAAALLLGSLFFVAAVLVCRAARLSPEDRSAITIEASLRNINLGILVKASLFPASEAHPIGDAMLFALAYFGGVQMVIAAIPILTRRFGFVP